MHMLRSASAQCVTPYLSPPAQTAADLPIPQLRFFLIMLKVSDIVNA